MKQVTALPFGIDIGYGYVKGASTGLRFHFPSLLGSGETRNFRLQAIPPEEERIFTVDLGAARYVVGEDAKTSVEVFPLRTRDWVTSKNYRAFAIAALRMLLHKAELTPESCPPLYICTGLPVNYMRASDSTNDKETCKEVLLSVCAEMKLSVEDIDVIPQPFGTLFDCYLGNNGEIIPDSAIIEASRIAILDIGYNTTDSIVVEDFERYLERVSDSITIGAHTCYERIADKVRDTLGLEHVAIRSVEKALETMKYTGKGGRTHDISELVRSVLQTVGDQLATRLRSKWKAEGEVDMVVVSGGGGALLLPYLRNLHARIHTPSDQQMANASGFHKRALSLITA